MKNSISNIKEMITDFKDKAKKSRKENVFADCHQVGKKYIRFLISTATNTKKMSESSRD